MHLGQKETSLQLLYIWIFIERLHFENERLKLQETQNMLRLLSCGNREMSRILKYSSIAWTIYCVFNIHSHQIWGYGCRERTAISMQAQWKLVRVNVAFLCIKIQGQRWKPCSTHLRWTVWDVHRDDFWITIGWNKRNDKPPIRNFLNQITE